MSKLLLYCTKANKQKDLLWSNNLKYFFLDGAYNRVIDNLPKYLLNGKIVAECDFEVEEIEKVYGTHHASFDENGYFDDYYDYMTKTIDEDILLKRSCLNVEELENYNPNYAIHIKNLHIFDEPKELENYYHFVKYYIEELKQPITKAPQNMMYAQDENQNKQYILISIQPQWLCKILNGEKTVEIRKKVLREMIK